VRTQPHAGVGLRVRFGLSGVVVAEGAVSELVRAGVGFPVGANHGAAAGCLVGAAEGCVLGAAEGLVLGAAYETTTEYTVTAEAVVKSTAVSLTLAALTPAGRRKV
jgi:hypothetical protein